MTRFGLVFLVVLAGAAFAGLAYIPTNSERERVSSRGPLEARPVGRIATEGPVDRNQRVTALAGIVLYTLLIAIALTVLDVRRFLGAHYLVGFLLIPPVILKLVSTGYRFLRYYSGSVPFREAGAPPLLLRFVVAPVLVVATATVFVTGLELWLFGLQFGSVWISAHTLSAVVMVIALAAHLLAQMRLSADVLVDATSKRQQSVLAPGSLAVASLVGGAVLAAASLLYVSPFTTSIAGG